MLPPVDALMRCAVAEGLDIPLETLQMPIPKALLHLPTRSRGLGITSAAMVAPGAYLASSLHCSAHLAPLIARRSRNGAVREALATDMFLEDALQRYNALLPAVGQLQVPLQQRRQQEFTAAVNAHLLQQVLDHVDSVASDEDRSYMTTLLAEFSHPTSGAWLRARPREAHEWASDEQVRVKVLWRLLLPVMSVGACPLCRAQCDKWGRHALSCNKTAPLPPHQGRRPGPANSLDKRPLSNVSRHDDITNLLAAEARRSGVFDRVEVEPEGLYDPPHQALRPDYVTYTEHGRPVVVDVMCPNSLAHKLDRHGAPKAMNVAANRKHRTHDDPCRAAHLRFTPFAVSLFGVYHKEAAEELKRLARASVSRDPRLVYSQHVHRLRVKVVNVLGNAAAEAVIRRHSDQGELFRLLRSPY